METLTLKAKILKKIAEGEEAPALLTDSNQNFHLQTVCLLLDISGSMETHIEPMRSKWQALKEMLPMFPGVQKYVFSDSCFKISGDLPSPNGGTNMALAFTTLKQNAIFRAVLITDGIPNNEEQALKAAQGLHLDIFYVGPPPMPEFLEKLAQRANGKAEMASLASVSQPKLVQEVKRLLLIGSKKP